MLTRNNCESVYQYPKKCYQVPRSVACTELDAVVKTWVDPLHQNGDLDISMT
jgi:hypothetical protein